MQISFSMIVSVILIIAFLGAAFYAIAKFLDLQKDVQVGQFVSNLQFDIDKIWKSSQGSQEKTYNLPSKIEKVCFVDFKSPEKGENSVIFSKLQKVFFGNENLVFYPVGSGKGIDSIEITHIDIEKITEKENPFCVDSDGKIKIILSMDFGENLVKIEYGFLF